MPLPDYIQYLHEHWRELNEILTKLERHELSALGKLVGVSSSTMIDPIWNEDGKREIIKDILEKLRDFRIQQDELRKIKQALTILDQRGVYQHEG